MWHPQPAYDITDVQGCLISLRTGDSFTIPGIREVRASSIHAWVQHYRDIAERSMPQTLSPRSVVQIEHRRADAMFSVQRQIQDAYDALPRQMAEIKRTFGLQREAADTDLWRVKDEMRAVDAQHVERVGALSDAFRQRQSAVNEAKQKTEPFTSISMSAYLKALLFGPVEAFRTARRRRIREQVEPRDR